MGKLFTRLVAGDSASIAPFRQFSESSIRYFGSKLKPRRRGHQSRTDSRCNFGLAIRSLTFWLSASFAVRKGTLYSGKDPLPLSGRGKEEFKAGDRLEYFCVDFGTIGTHMSEVAC